MTRRIWTSPRVVVAFLASIILFACEEREQQSDPPAGAPTQRANDQGSLPKEGAASLAPLIGRWATRPEYCAAASPEAGALMEIAKTGLTSGSMRCAFAKVTRNGPRYDIVSNCSAESSGPVPDERLIFVFMGSDNFEWRTEEGAVQLAYLRCPRTDANP